MKKIFFLIAMLGATGCASAQYYYDKLYSIGLDLNQPISNTDFLDSFSASGARFNFNKFITENLTAGLEVNWNKFEQHEPRQTYYSSNGALTAEYFKYIVTYGLALKFAYYLKPTEKFTLFFGLGVGASNVDYKVYYNIYSDGDNSWGVSGKPEAGVLYRLGQNSSWGVTAAVHFTYSSSKSERFEYSSFSTVGVTVGVVSLDW